LAWVGADTTGVHLDARTLTPGASPLQSSVTVLPLPPTHPHDSQLALGGGDAAHLLWLDADDNRISQLHSAVITAERDVFRGPLLVSQGRTNVRCYDVLPSPDGALWAAWNDGDPVQPTIQSAYIGPSGLILRRQPLAQAAGCPMIAPTLTGAFVLWVAGDVLHLSDFLSGGLLNTRPITASPPLASGDRVRSVRVGADDTHIYTFWNITRADGTDQTWAVAGTSDADRWGEPSLLRFISDPSTPFETTFNTGQSFAAAPDASGLTATWAAPLDGVTGLLPVAVWANGQLGVLYFDSGTVAGYQAVIATGPLLAPPALTLDRDRHLYLAWSEPTATGAAQLRLTTTKPLTGGG